MRKIVTCHASDLDLHLVERAKIALIAPRETESCPHATPQVPCGAKAHPVALIVPAQLRSLTIVASTQQI
jgi:hypothetical protein